MGMGADCGTMNLVIASRNEDGDIECKREVNAFIEVPLSNPFTFNMLKEAGVPLIKRENVAYAIGEDAVNIAYTWNTIELKRPMAKGCVNPKEKSAFNILKTMLHSLIGEVSHDEEIVCYSVPANAINEETDADYHQKVLKAIFNSYEVNGKKIKAIPINEALALVYAELGNKMLTGISISAGSGMINVCYANMSVPIFQFSLVNSGDWIDERAAKAVGETPTFINKEKMKIDLMKEPENLIERAIQTQYRIMIENTMKGIKEGLGKAGNKARSDKPVDIIIAGGTSLPAGFTEIAKETIEDLNFPIEIGEIKRAKDPLYAVARGCLKAAEAAEMSG